jgi:hypothetical protein
VKSSVEVKVGPGSRGFAEDKDAAKKLRTEVIMPALSSGQSVIIDFRGVTSSTQSFVHALVGEALQTIGEPVLNRLEFRSCAPQVKTVVELVVDYSLGGFTKGSSPPIEVGTESKTKKSSHTRSTPKARLRKSK